jgi:hypothetical protein
MIPDHKQRRFNVDKNCYVIDKAYPASRGKYKYRVDPSYSDSEIRGTILWQGIRRLLRKLIVGCGASEIRLHLGYMLVAAIDASQLGALDPLLALQHPFNGKLRRKEGMADYTSISLFIRDVERLLRELYGDLGRAEFDIALYAIRQIVVAFITFVRPDLAAEYNDADNIDLRMGIRRPEEFGGVSGSEHREAMMAARVLAVRKLQVAFNPTAYARYTLRFVKALNKYWPKLGGISRSA